MLALAAAAGTTLLRVAVRGVPAVMAPSTVVTADHYVLDVLVGAAFGLAGWVVALRLERRAATVVRLPAQRQALPRGGPPAPRPGGRGRAVHGCESPR